MDGGGGGRSNRVFDPLPFEGVHRTASLDEQRLITTLTRAYVRHNNFVKLIVIEDD